MRKTNSLMQLWLTLQFLWGVVIVLRWPEWANISMPLLALGWVAARWSYSRLQKSGSRKSAYCFLVLALLHLPLGLIGVYAIIPTLRQRLLANAHLSEKLNRLLLLLSTLLVASVVVLIIFFIIVMGLWAPGLSGQLKDWQFFFSHIQLRGFLLSLDWSPTTQPPYYGILAFIFGTFYMTLLAVAIALPLSIAVAVFISELAGPRVRAFTSTVVELLAGVPSVLFGFVGVTAVTPFIRQIFPYQGNSGFNVLSGSLVLAVMVLPTITNVAVATMRSVSDELRQASQALGATKWLTTVRTVLPKAGSGIITGIVLGINRAVGETTAVVMIAGNATNLALSPLSSVRSLTMNIVSEMSYAQDDPLSGNFHLTALFASALILLIVINLLNIITKILLRKEEK